MYAAKHKAPVGDHQVDLPGDRRDTFDLNKGVQVFGHQDAAQRLEEHEHKEQQAQDRSYHAACSQLSMKRSLIPFMIQRMMDNEQGKHRRPDRLMKCFSNQGIGHQEQQEHGHGKIRYYENEKNVGAIDVVDNWNKLLSLVNGEFLICMGDDDKLAENCLEEYNSLIDRHPGLNVYHARTLMIDENSEFCDLQEERPEWQSVYSLIWHYTFKEGVQFVGDFLFRTDSLRKNGGFYKLPLAWCSDCVTSFIASASKGVANTVEPIFFYRQNSKSITKNSNIRVKMQATKMYSEWMIDFLRKEPDNEMDKKYWHLIKNGFNGKIHHHETYMVGNDIKNNFFSGIRYWMRNRKEYKLSVTQFLFAVGIGLAMKIR